MSSSPASTASSLTDALFPVAVLCHVDTGPLSASSSALKGENVQSVKHNYSSHDALCDDDHTPPRPPVFPFHMPLASAGPLSSSQTHGPDARPELVMIKSLEHAACERTVRLVTCHKELVAAMNGPIGHQELVNIAIDIYDIGSYETLLRVLIRAIDCVESLKVEGKFRLQERDYTTLDPLVSTLKQKTAMQLHTLSWDLGVNHPYFPFLPSSVPKLEDLTAYTAHVLNSRAGCAYVSVKTFRQLEPRLRRPNPPRLHKQSRLPQRPPFQHLKYQLSAICSFFPRLDVLVLRASPLCPVQDHLSCAVRTVVLDQSEPEFWIPGHAINAVGSLCETAKLQEVIVHHARNSTLRDAVISNYTKSANSSLAGSMRLAIFRLAGRTRVSVRRPETSKDPDASVGLLWICEAVKDDVLREFFQMFNIKTYAAYLGELTLSNILNNRDVTDLIHLRSCPNIKRLTIVFANDIPRSECETDIFMSGLRIVNFQQLETLQLVREVPKDLQSDQLVSLASLPGPYTIWARELQDFVEKCSMTKAKLKKLQVEMEGIDFKGPWATSVDYIKRCTGATVWRRET